MIFKFYIVVDFYYEIGYVYEGICSRMKCVGKNVEVIF